jgi:phage protein D
VSSAPTAAERYVPDFRLEIGGEEVPRAVRSAINGISYQDGHQAADRVEVTLANVDLRWLQHHIKGLGVTTFPTAMPVAPDNVLPKVPGGLFDLDNSVRLALGYAPGPLEEVFQGEITGVEASFPADGMPTLTVVAHDAMHRMLQGKYGRGFGPLPDFIIASILAFESRLIPIIEATVQAASTAVAAVNLIFNGTGRKQKGQSAHELLSEIAATYDADFYVEGDFLYVTRFMKEYSPRLSLRWGHSLVSFQPKVTSVGQAFGVGMKFTLREIPLDFLVTVYWDFDRETLVISVLPGVAAPAASGPVVTFIDRPIGTPADIMNSVLVMAHELRTKLNNRLTGRGTCIGDPRVRAGAVIRLEDLGPDFSGDYRVTAATHTVGPSGYTTSFEVQKEIIP